MSDHFPNNIFLNVSFPEANFPNVNYKTFTRNYTASHSKIFFFLGVRHLWIRTRDPIGAVFIRKTLKRPPPLFFFKKKKKKLRNRQNSSFLFLFLFSFFVKKKTKFFFCKNN